MKVLVTGGAGFIGANLCRELARRPDVAQVTVLDNLSTGSADNLDGVPVDLVVGTILDRDLVGRLVASADAVVHLAACPSVPRSLADPVASHEANATGTLYVLEACRQAGTYVVGASSSSVYGSAPQLPKHEDLPTRPISPYAASKLATEGYLLAYGSSFGVPSLALRFFNVYGPLQKAGHAYAAVIPAFIDAALRGEPLTVHGDGRQTRDFTYVGSVAGVLADAVSRRAVAATPVNLAFGVRVSLLELIAELANAMGGRPLSVVYAPSRVGDVPASQADWTRLAALFPQARAVPFADGLARTVEWYRQLPEYREPLAMKIPTVGSPVSAAAGSPREPGNTRPAALESPR